MTEGGGGSEKVKISVTSFMKGPLIITTLLEKDEHRRQNLIIFCHKLQSISCCQLFLANCIKDLKRSKIEHHRDQLKSMLFKYNKIWWPLGLSDEYSNV